MLATSPSPNTSPATTFEPGWAVYSSSPRSRYDHTNSNPLSARPANLEQTSSITRKRSLLYSRGSHKARRSPSTRSLGRSRSSPQTQPRPEMVDASTQYSPPTTRRVEQTPTSRIADLELSEAEDQASRTAILPAAVKRRDGTMSNSPRSESTITPAQTKRHAPEPPPAKTHPQNNGVEQPEPVGTQQSPLKKGASRCPTTTNHADTVRDLQYSRSGCTHCVHVDGTDKIQRRPTSS